MVNVNVAVDALKDANASYANTQLEIVSVIAMVKEVNVIAMVKEVNVIAMVKEVNVIAMVKEVNVIAMTMTMSERESDNLL
jgi:hypothetical protein